MIKVKPFCGVTYNKDKIRDLSKVLAPPYDVISPKEQEEYYRRSPYNIIRIILGKDYPDDNASQNKYTRAKKFFNTWMSEKILIRDTKPCIYVYEQSKRIGILALLGLEKFGKSVFPHEETFPKHKKDRWKLLNATKANFNPIFALYTPSSKTIDAIIREKIKEKPLFSVKLDGILNKIWKIEEEAKIEKITKAMQHCKVFIADGHHRYETSLEYALKMRAKNNSAPGESPYDFVMTMFVKMDDPELIILPTHRLLKRSVKVSECQSAKLSKHVIPAQAGIQESVRVEIHKYFNIQKFGSLDRMFRTLYRTKYSFGIYEGDKRYYLLSVRNIKDIEKKFENDIPKCWRQLDMVILHHFFFKHILQIEPTPQETIKYVADPKEAVKLVNKGEYQIAFFLNSIKPEKVKEIALSGEKMPHKATYFYPKPLSGLVINKM